MTAAKPTPKGAVDLASLKGNTPDSVRIHPYRPSVHTASKYEMEPETRPRDYKPGRNVYFNMARRKVYMLVLGLVIGGIILGAFIAIIAAIISIGSIFPPNKLSD